MNKMMLAVLLGLLATAALARDMTTRQAECYGRIKQEADFIVSRINLIHRDYESRLKRSAIGGFKSGQYSTTRLLDNTIRRYHRKLVRRLKNYPFRYEASLRGAQGSKHAPCLARKLQNESVGTIHEFEVSWQRAFRKARDNARYFRQLDNMH